MMQKKTNNYYRQRWIKNKGWFKRRYKAKKKKKFGCF